MTGALIILAAVVITGLILWLGDRGNSAGGDAPRAIEAQHATDGECCGMHAVCEKVPATLQAEYFNDEELDAFAGRPSDSYSSVEVEEFHEVMMTLRPEERAPWAVAIERRGIALPDCLRDELILLIEDA